ncbi:MAG: DUF6801 domain-containing protein [Actinomycetota bacterium]
MNLFHNRSRLVAASIAGVFAAGSVLTLGAAPAGAVDTSYTCTLTTGAVPFPTSAANPLPKTVVKGSKVPVKKLSMDVTVPNEVVGLLGFLGVTSLSVAEPTMTVGQIPVPVNNLGAALPATPADPYVVKMSGKTSSFTAPDKLGTYPVKLPESFGLVPAAGETPIGTFPCAPTAGASTKVGTMRVVNASKMTAKLTNAPVTTAERARVAVGVVTEGKAAKGQVVAKQGKKVLARGKLNDKGRALLRLPKLERGQQKVVVRYLGNKTTNAGQKVLKFVVRRG